MSEIREMRENEKILRFFFRWLTAELIGFS
jgi:hypothetical protein